MPMSWLPRPAIPEVSKFGAVAELRLPHRHNLEAVFCSHDARGVVAETGVECGLVLLEDLVDAQLLDHDCLLAEEIGSDGALSNQTPQFVNRVSRTRCGTK